MGNARNGKEWGKDEGAELAIKKSGNYCCMCVCFFSFLSLSLTQLFQPFEITIQGEREISKMGWGPIEWQWKTRRKVRELKVVISSVDGGTGQFGITLVFPFFLRQSIGTLGVEISWEWRLKTRSLTKFFITRSQEPFIQILLVFVSWWWWSLVMTWSHCRVSWVVILYLVEL